MNKKTIISAVAAAFCLSPMTAAGQQTTVTREKDSDVTVLTESGYRKQVEDFTTKEWKYLGNAPAIVDFYADWCGPCRRLSPVLEKIASEYRGRLKVYKVNVDNAGNLASYYGISNIPYVLFIPVSGEPQAKVGLMSERQVKDMVDGFLLKK